MTDQASHPHAGFKQAINGSWRLDRERSSVEFRTRGLWGLMTVRGHFEVYDGWLDLAADPAIELTIDASSVRTGNRKRDEHLRSADFFDSEHHPHVRFASESVELEAADGGPLRVRGRLFARGCSIPLELAAQVRPTGGELELDAAVTAPHRELGMTWNWLGAIASRSRLQVRARLVSESSGR